MENTEKILLKNMLLNKFTISFSSENEKAFREKYFTESLRLFRLSFLLVTFLYGVFGLLDLLLVRELETLFHFIRFAVVVPLLLTVLLLSYLKIFRYIWQQLIFICELTGGIGVIIMITKAPENYLYYSGLMLIFSAGYFFIALRFFMASLAGWTIVLIFNIAAIFFSGMNSTTIVGANAFFIAANLISMFAAYNIELYKRKDFFLNNELDHRNMAITEANKNLEQNVVERTKELVAAKEKAEESDRLKSAFLANMSHEIRTPMNGILGFTNLLNDPHFSGEEKTDFIKIIQKSGQRLMNTVNDLIDISKIETGQMTLQLEYCNILERIESLQRFFKIEASEKNIRLEVVCDVEKENENLITDINKIDSILTNLIKNAIKYTDSGSIEIGCRYTDNFYIFSVRDTGIGIPKKRQEAIFNRFEQADLSDRRGYEGSGLGLAIAKAYVEMLDGTIRIESEEGRGSTFYIKLPVKKEMNDVLFPVSLQNIPSGSKPQKFKIIIAEDDDIGYTYLVTILRTFDCTIIRTITGTETIRQIKEYPDTDIILMDIKMPEMDGLTATRHIRTFNSKVKIIAQTAFSLQGDRSKALQAGCDDYISKPIKKNELIDLINKNLHS